MRKHKTATRLLSWLLVSVMTLTMLPGPIPTVLAEGGAYTYEPLQYLYANGKPVMFLDYGMTALNVSGMTGAQSRSRLDSRKMSLNGFGALIQYAVGSGNELLSDRTAAAATFDGKIDPRAQTAASFGVSYDFSSFLPSGSSPGSSIVNMLTKQDIELTAAFSVYTRQFDKAPFNTDKSTRAEIKFLDQSWYFNGKDMPNLWNKVNYGGKNDEADGVLTLTGTNTRWVIPTETNLKKLSYYSYSVNEGPVDSKMRYGIVVGRDIRGPSILAVDVYVPENGELPAHHPYSATTGNWDNDWGARGGDNRSGYKTITVDDVGKTVYFSVMFDEPVKFKDAWATPGNLSNLTLIVKTMGRDGSDAVDAAAKFHSYAPGTTDSCPVMIFSYKIQDPKNPEPGGRNDSYYTFSRVNINTSENADIYNNITDLAGNSFNKWKDGAQKNWGGDFDVRLSGTPTVDLDLPVIESVEVSRDGESQSAYLQAGDTVTVALNLNKALSAKTLSLGQAGYYPSLPTIKLNFGGWSDIWTTRAETGKKDTNSPELTTLYYAFKVKAGDEISSGEHIKITDINIPNDCLDDAGYKLSDDLSKLQYKQQYHVDTVAPAVTVTVDDRDAGLGIYGIKASLTDTSPVLAAAFFISVKAESADTIQYQRSANGSYSSASGWQEAGGSTIDVNAPALDNAAWVFLKLPTENVYIDSISGSVSATDDAGNTGRGDFNQHLGIDKVRPTVTLTTTRTVGGQAIQGYGAAVTGQDKHLAGIFEYACVPDSTNTTTAPIDGWTTALWTSNNGVYYDDDGYGRSTFSHDLNVSGSALYEYVLWVRVKDESDNTVTAALACSYDNRYAEMTVNSVSHDPNELIWLKDTAAGDLPSVTVTLGANVTDFSYSWVAPGGYSIGMTTGAALDTLIITMPDDADLSKITGPTKLTLTAKGSTGPNRVETITFNTLYDASDAGVFTQTAFSSSDASGRIDERRGNKGLLTPASTRKAVNATTLTDIGAAEFTFATDHFSALDWDKTKLTLRKVAFKSPTGTMTAASAEGVSFENESPVSSQNVHTWQLTEDDFIKAGSAYNFSARIDLKDDAFADLTSAAYEIDASGNVTLIRYEFWMDAAYIGTADTAETLLGVFAFHNTLPDEVSYLAPQVAGMEPQAAYRASLAYDAGESKIVDNSGVVPRITLTTRPFGTGDIPGSFTLQSTVTAQLPAAAHKMLSDGTHLGEPPFQNNSGVKTNAYRLEIGGAEKLEVDAATGIFTVKKDVAQWASLTPDASGGVISGSVGIVKTAERVQRVYYQITDAHMTDWQNGNAPDSYPNKDRYSPVYCVDIVWDTDFPVVSFNPSGAGVVSDGADGNVKTDGPATQRPVTVDFFAADGHTEGAGDTAYYVMDTPEDKITTEVLSSDYDNSASDEDGNDGAQLDPETGLYVFKRNGKLKVQATDAAGNKKTYTLAVTTIDREGPDISRTDSGYTYDADGGGFTLNVDIAGGATSAMMIFNAEYTAYLTGIPTSEFPRDGTYYDIYHPDYPKFEVSDTVSGTMGGLPGVLSSVVTRNNAGEITNISMTVYSVYADPKTSTTTNGISSVQMQATDALGNNGFHNGSITLWPTSLGYLKGRAAEITNPDKIYTFGGTLDFNVPVKLEVFTEDGAKTDGLYSKSHVNLPVYASGAVAVRYTDLFGNIYNDAITADMGDCAHKVTIDPSGKTQGPVTVTVDTNGFDCAVTGGTAGVWTKTVTENGNVAYEITPSGGPAKPFTTPVTNIDNDPPVASYDRKVNGTESFDENGDATVTGTVTYTILGFSEQDVTMAEGETKTFTFTEAGTHTFNFTDAVGNAGTLTVDESGTSFVSPPDTTITQYRLSYTTGVNSSPVQADADADTPEFDDFPAGSTAELLIPQTNQNITVLIEALNAEGEVLPATMTYTAADGVWYGKNTLVFTKETAASVTLTAGNAVGATVVVPPGTIDQTPPTGTVEYALLTEDDPDYGFVRGGVKAYLRPDDPDEIGPGDIAYVAFSNPVAVLRTDSDGSFVYFEENGGGMFYMSDKAGNIGSVAVFAYDVDLKAPGIGAESWYGTNGIDMEEVLGNITNNSIRLLLRFDEPIARAEVAAYAEGGSEPVLNPSDYIKYPIGGNTLTIEFKKNCQARITVYDIKGNAYTILRPEDGPVTVIDKDAPTFTKTPETKDNKVSFTYTFNEEVASAAAEGEFKTSHTVEFAKNGVYPLTFVDRAGNIANDVVEITQIDTLSPELKYTLTVEGGTRTLYDSVNTNKIIATDGSVKITLSATDISGVTLSVANLNSPAVPVPIQNDAVTVTENGTYEITAKDAWGNTTQAQARIDFIDRLAPVISLESTKAVNITAGDSQDDLTAALLAGATARDEREGNVTAKITLDVSAVNPDTPGSYTATYAVADALGNESKRTRTVRVNGGDPLTINGEIVWPDDICITTAGSIPVSAPAGYTLYWAAGKKTYGEMKYAAPLSGPLNAAGRGYYTILAQGADRDAYLVYVYVD